MSLFRWQNSFDRVRQQLVSMLLFVAVVAALLPIPYFSFPAKQGKDFSRPFPCQDRPCGCRSAEQCKKKCCCYSAEQKLAWAKRHGVKASEVVAVAKPDVVQVTTKKLCCSGRRASTSQKREDDRRAKRTTASLPETKGASRHKLVIGVMAQECQGIAQTPFGQAVFLIPSVVCLKPHVIPTGERFVLQGSRFVDLFAEPPVPPPRLFAA